MSPEGYRARISAIEWWANLWVSEGLPYEMAQEIMGYCCECVDADYYGVARLEPPNDEAVRIQAALDAIFVSPGPQDFS